MILANISTATAPQPRAQARMKCFRSQMGLRTGTCALPLAVTTLLRCLACVREYTSNWDTGHSGKGAGGEREKGEIAILFYSLLSYLNDFHSKHTLLFFFIKERFLKEILSGIYRE